MVIAKQVDPSAGLITCLSSVTLLQVSDLLNGPMALRAGSTCMVSRQWLSAHWANLLTCRRWHMFSCSSWSCYHGLCPWSVTRQVVPQVTCIEQEQHALLTGRRWRVPAPLLMREQPKHVRQPQVAHQQVACPSHEVVAVRQFMSRGIRSAWQVLAQ